MTEISRNQALLVFAIAGAIIVLLAAIGVFSVHPIPAWLWICVGVALVAASIYGMLENGGKQRR